jgi:hypothetical protein
MVLSLVDMLIDVASPLHPYVCDGTMLSRLALPCARDLWRASTRAEWASVWERQAAAGAAPQRMLSYGDLLHRRALADRALESWVTQVDDVGALVLVAASMPDER